MYTAHRHIHVMPSYSALLMSLPTVFILPNCVQVFIEVHSHVQLEDAPGPNEPNQHAYDTGVGLQRYLFNVQDSHYLTIGALLACYCR